MWSQLKSDRWLIPLCFAVVYIVWGSTYLANYFAIQDIPPFLMSGSRFLTAGAVLFALSFALGASKPTLQYWKNGTFLGILFLCIGTGGIVWAMRWVHSGIAALMVAFQPLLIVLLMWQSQGKRPSLRTLAGTALGMAGMACLVGQDQLISDRETLIGVAVIFISIFSWGYASIKISKIALPSSKPQSAGIQMMGGGIALLIASLLSGEVSDFQAIALTSKGIGSWLYLVFFGSIVAYSAFNYLLVKSTPDKVATSNYVNPVVALFLGWWLNNEVVSGQSLLATVLMLTGVVLINSRFPFFRKNAPAPLAPAALTTVAPEAEFSTKEIDFQPFTCMDTPMIARIWHGTSLIEKAGDYVEWTKNIVLPEVQNSPGNVGMTLLRHDEGNLSHLTVISYWKDEASVRQFAGEDVAKARIFPEEGSFLVAFEEEVEHKTVLGRVA